MRRIVFGLVGVVCSLSALMAQGDPQPTCKMCPGTYIPKSEIEAYTAKAVAEKLIDQQARDIDIGKAHIGIGVVHRGKLTSPAPESVAGARSRQRGLSHHRRLGDARHQPRHRRHEAAAGDARDRAPVQRSGQQRIVGAQRRRARAEGGRRHRDSRGHRPLVHEDRRPHQLPDGPHRSRTRRRRSRTKRRRRRTCRSRGSRKELT